LYISDKGKGLGSGYSDIKKSDLVSYIFYWKKVSKDILSKVFSFIRTIFSLFRVFGLKFEKFPSEREQFFSLKEVFLGS
jgi:GTP-sensing pleiotropic transcriptional regulator CodY